MKAILIIDIADDIAEAYEDFTVDYDLRGTPKDDQITNESIKYVEDCPLKPLPEKKHGRLIDADAYLKKVCTYKKTGCGSCRFQIVCPQDEPTINDCIDEITGETE